MLIRTKAFFPEPLTIFCFSFRICSSDKTLSPTRCNANLDKCLKWFKKHARTRNYRFLRHVQIEITTVRLHIFMNSKCFKEHTVIRKELDCSDRDYNRLGCRVLEARSGPCCVVSLPLKWRTPPSDERETTKDQNTNHFLVGFGLTWNSWRQWQSLGQGQKRKETRVRVCSKPDVY